ncbi:hypothetical protein NQ318_017164 [Aromia moschata]|uniref:Uncharacterized protein n=1 Tax=Aromia moschata TaxID=1265417 RepID=A0AAV8YQB9_9CUCU|nr:hypothetical protein NQ318_017164 [Aromia moschata]
MSNADGRNFLDGEDEEEIINEIEVTGDEAHNQRILSQRNRLVTNDGRRWLNEMVIDYFDKETGDVRDLPKSGRPKITQYKKFDIVISMEENPQSTFTLVASENEVSQTTVLGILRKENYHPYKFQLVQGLNKDDPNKKI